jgi:hypothetical protein
LFLIFKDPVFMSPSALGLNALAELQSQVQSEELAEIPVKPKGEPRPLVQGVVGSVDNLRVFFLI